MVRGASFVYIYIGYIQHTSTHHICALGVMALMTYLFSALCPAVGAIHLWETVYIRNTIYWELIKRRELLFDIHTFCVFQS